MAKTTNHGIIRGDYGRTETGLPKLSALAIDKGLGKIKGAKDDHILKGKEAYLLGGDLGWNLSSDNAFIFHGPAAFGITQNYNRSDTGLGGSSTMSYSGDMLKVANTLKIDPSAYTNYSPYLQTYAGSQYGASSLNASTTQKLIKQNKARWVEDPVSGKQLLAAVDPKTGQVKTTVNQNKLYSLIEDATANIYTVGGYVNNKNENSAIPADPSKKNNHAFVTFSKGDDGVLTPISEPTYYKADRVIEEEGFFEGLINGLVGIASSEAGQLILAAVTMGNSFGVDKLIPQVAAKLGVNTIVAAGIVNAGANAALSLFTGGDIGKAAIYGAITGAAGAGATPIAKTMIGADNLTKLAKFAGISEKAAANYLVNSFAGASATKILNNDSNFVDTFRNNLLASYGGDKASSYVKNFINELGGKDFSLAGNLAGNTARALVTAGVTDPANAMQVLSNSWQGILVQSIGMTKAEEKAFKTYQKTAEEIQARDKTVLALNNGEIKITGKDVNGDYILDNGMTLDKNGKFYQGGKQLYADAAGYNQNSIFTADNKGKDIKIADTAGGKLTSDEAKALFRRDYGIDISDDDADLFAGKTVKNITDADVSRLTKNALGAEYKKITGEDLTDEEANKYIALGGNALDNMRYQLVGKGEIDQILDDVYKDPSLKIDVAQALPVTAEQALQLSRTAESIAARDLLARAANDPSFARTLTSDAAIESFRNKGMSALADTLSRFATGVGALVTPGNAFQQTNEDAIMAEKLKNYLKPITTEDYAAKGLPPVVVTGTKGVESIGPDGELLQDGKSTGLYIDKAGTLYDDEGNPAIENYWPTNKVPNTVPWIPGPKFPLKDPSVKPDIKPTITPTVIPTPTVTPSPTATPTPTVKPTVVPTVLPTVSPTVVPTTEPIVEPTVVPTAVPTVAPTPTVEPTTEPTQKPTVVPTTLPTAVPTVAPTTLPTAEPTVEPTTSPTTLPTVQPTVVPTVAPTTLPTTVPTAAPTTQVTTVPTAAPTTDVATAPTAVPTTAVTTAPTTAVTAAPTTVITPIPTTTVTTVPTAVVTTIPTTEVTVKPTITPTPTPTVVVTPTPSPTPSPTPTVVVTPTPSPTPTTKTEGTDGKDGENGKDGGRGLPGLAGAAAIAAGPIENYYAKFKDPFITSKEKQTPFVGSLDPFLKEVGTGDYASADFGDEGGLPAPQGELPMQQADYFNYGAPKGIDEILGMSEKEPSDAYEDMYMYAAKGGLATPLMAKGGGTRHGKYAGGGLPLVSHSGKVRVDYRQGDAVTGPGDGQSDDIPAMLADGEFVIPADVVAALGNGSTKAGSDKLYDMMHSIRKTHRSAKSEDLPPEAKASPLDYITKRKPRR